MKKTTYEEAVIANSIKSTEFTDGVLASEIRYRRLFESSRDGILILDATTRTIIDVNPFMINMLGYSREEFIGKELWELGLLKDEEASKAAFTELQESGYIRYGDLRLETDLGRRCEVEFISNVYDEGDRQVIQCNIRDITGRKEAENKMESLADDLEEAAEDYRRVLDNSLDVICQIDKAGKFIKVSPAAKRVWGYEPEELIGTMYWDMVHPDDQIKTHHAAGNTLAGKPTSTFENRTIRKDGAVAYMMWSGNWSEPHQIMYCVARDVSEIKLAETALEESETNYRTLIESLPAIVYLAETYAPFAPIYLSPNVAAFDRSPDEWKSDPDTWVNLIHVDDRERFLHKAKEAIEIGEDTDLEYRIVTNDGNVHWMSDKGQLIRDSDGKITGWQRIIVDVTAGKEAEIVIGQSREWLNGIVEGSRDGILVEEGDHVVFANKALADLYGYGTPDEMIGKHISAFRSDDDDEKMLSYTKKRIADEDVPSTYEFKGVRRDGSVFDVDVSVSSFISSGRTYVVSTLRNVTGRKLAEEELKKSEERYRDLVENAHDIIFTRDMDGNIISINAAGENLTGYTRKEFLQMNVRQIIAPEDLKRVETTIAGEVSGVEGVSDEMDILAKDGRRITLEVNRTLMYRGGVPVGVQAIARNITRRKFAEEAHSRMAAMLESSPDFAGYADAKTARLLYINKGGRRLLGLGEDEDVTQLTISDVHPSWAFEMLRDSIIPTVRRDGTWSGECAFLHRDGRELPGLMAIVAHKSSAGEVEIMSMMSHDITERNTLEDQLRQAQKMEAVGQMAGGIAHDFNNMLTAINGYSDLTLRQMKADDPLRHNIKEIKKAGERSAELTNQLLAFSRQQILQPEVVFLNRIITETSTLLERMIGEDVELITVLNSKTGKIKADPGQLSQIVMNLAVNARDAMPKGGKLTFETTNTFLDTEYTNHHVSVLPGAYVKLTVSDNGIGMDAETQQHIFEPFFTTKAAGEGTGLGLSMVYGIVKQSNGHIMVYSEPGIGTTFTIYLPRVMEPLEEADAVEVSNELLMGTETILLVEDEEIVRVLTRQILEMCGYTVLEAANGNEALALCENNPGIIDLLMTDVVMPGMSGSELAEKVSLSCPVMHVLFTSGYTDDAVVRHGVINSASSFIQKPFTTEALARKVRELLDSNG